MLDINEEELHRHSVRTLFARHRLSLPGILGMTATLLFAYRDADKTQLAIWVSMLGLNTLVQWYCIRSYFINPTRFKPYDWARLLTVSSGTMATVMGMSVLLFLDFSNQTHVLLVTLFLVGPIFGSTLFAAAYFPIHLFWCFGTMIPLVVCFIFSGVTDFIILGFALLLMAIPSALILGWMLAGEFKRGLRSHFENIRLIDELRHEKLRVENISHDKSRFLTAVSHDLRQPLHALDLFHASLKSKLEQEDQKKLLGLACQSSRALGEMLGELMDIARFDAGKIRPELQMIPLVPLLKECADEMQLMAVEKRLKLRVRLPRKACVVNSDPVLLKRILRNLLSNAIRHSESGGVLLGTRMRDSCVHIEVHDTGLGIAEAQLPHIFDEFYQIDNPERDREKGLGLGLAIVRRVAEVLNHHIHVRSQQGRGSCFSVIAPLGAAVGLCLQEVVQPEVDANVAGLFVFVVDDDRAILQGMRELLLGWGCEVLLAESEVDLFGKLTAHEYPPADVLISDYRLRHGHTGLDVARAVQAHFSSEIPTLIISGDVNPEVQAEVRAAGCYWQEKPVHDDVLKKMIAELGG